MRAKQCARIAARHLLICTRSHATQRRVFASTATTVATPVTASPVSKQAHESTHFGFQTVDASEKAGMVGDIFRRVADKLVGSFEFNRYHVTYILIAFAAMV